MNLEIQNLLEKYSNKHIIGTDEVGRGCLIGPVVASAVYLGKQKEEYKSITDSKKLTAKKRTSLSLLIQEATPYTAIAECSAQEIDQINILNASLLAMTKALKQVLQKMLADKVIQSLEEVVVLIDGNKYLKPADLLVYGLDTIQQEWIIKGDSLVVEIGAASILAKVYRDQLMEEYAQLDEFKVYNLQKNKGYPTKDHMQALIEHKASPLHRQTFKPVALHQRETDKK